MRTAKLQVPEARRGLLLFGSFKMLADAEGPEVAGRLLAAMIGLPARASAMQSGLFRKSALIERWLLADRGRRRRLPQNQ